MKNSRKYLKSKKAQHGFTLLEVLAATILFVLAISTVISARNRSLSVVTESGLLAQAQALAEMKMTEMEMKLQEGIDKAGVKSNLGKDEGEFESPYQSFKWSMEFVENPLVLKEEQLLGFLKAFGISDEESAQQFEQSKLVLANLNKTMLENMGELRVEVKWKFKNKDKNMLLVTHLIPKKPKISFTQNTDMDKN